ncbi:MAG: aminoacyl-tRNA hydrolase [Deltaproteobacteria bacterium]|nr:aminoacyl-tRNA hydrolase [Nannocystaceae bacterium]
MDHDLLITDGTSGIGGLAGHGPLVIPGDELSWTAARSAGPGGQNVNKVASKVDLRFDLEGSRVLSEAVKQRLRVLAAARIDALGRIAIVSQSARTQPRNLELARERLAELVRAALVPPKPRRKTRPSLGAKRRRLGEKRQRGETKAGRGRVQSE